MKFDRMHSLLCESEIRLQEDQYAILEYHLFMETLDKFDDDYLEEGIKDKVTGLLGKANLTTKGITQALGLHIGKSNQSRGLIQSLLASGINITRVIIAAFKARKGGPEEKEKFEEAMKKLKIKKEDLLDFLLRLDQVTMHLITGPIHMIDALMGWHIWADVKAQAVDITTKIKDAFTNMTQAVKDLPKKVYTSISKHLSGMKDTLITGGYTL